MNKKIKTASITITRKCNLRCSYCNIPDIENKNLPFSEWKKAINIIANIGVEKLTFIGGEPSLYPEIEKCVDFTLNEKNINTNFITNGVKSYDKIKSLIKLGLKNIATSVDSLDYNKSISPVKCKSGLELIERLENDNLLKDINFNIYCVLNKKNITDILKLVEFMSNKNIGVYFIPYHWGNEGTFEHRRNNNELAFTDENDFLTLDENIKKLILMKKEGKIILNSEKYLSLISKNIKSFDWKCSDLFELRVDSDGSMMCCCDKKGDNSNSYSIFDLEDCNVFSKFLNAREKDREECLGCFWPSSFESEYACKS